VIRRWDKSKPPRGPFTLNADCAQAQGLVLWYPLGGMTSGKAVYDLAGTLHPTTLLTGLTPTLGTSGEPALAFANGSSSIIRHDDRVPASAPPLSIGIWFAKTTGNDTTGHALANISANGANDRWQFDSYNGDVRWIAVNSAGSSGAASKSGIVSKKWHHALGIEESSSSRYACLDGVAGTQNTTAITVTSATKYWAIGAHAAGGTPTQAYFSGQMGEICVWNRSVYADRALIADPGQRFALWYPLRSRKWMVSAGGGATANLAATGASGTLSVTASTPATASLAQTGASGAFSASAYPLVTAALAAAGASGIFVGSASAPATATLAATGATGALSAAASSPATATLGATGGSGTLSASAGTGTSAALAALGGEGAFSGSAYPLTTAQIAAIGESGALSAIASTGARAALAATGGTSTLSASALVAASAALVATGSSGTLALSASAAGATIDPDTIRRVARSQALPRLVRSAAPVRSTNGL
jgi:hypothetical protein